MSEELYSIRAYCVVFFFQAEDGIRDLTVTGVQTCALPIYLAIHPAQPVIAPLGRAHAGGECATHAQLPAVLGHGETPRAGPLRQVLRLGPDPEHQGARRLERAPDGQLALRGRRDGAISCSCVHVLSPVVAVCRDMRRGARSLPPSSGDSARPSRPPP